jgi:hypothetical protein
VIAIWLAAWLSVPAPVPPDPRHSACPDGGEWVGYAPPHGHGYACMRERGGLPVRHGWAVTYHPETRRKIAECEYRDGLEHGHCSVYSADGRVLRRGMFDDGIAVGYHFRWDALPRAAAERVAALEQLLTEWEVPATELERLRDHVLAHYDSPLDDLRNSVQRCGERHCVSAGRIAGRNVIAIRLPPARPVAAL